MGVGTEQRWPLTGQWQEWTPLLSDALRTKVDENLREAREQWRQAYRSRDTALIHGFEYQIAHWRAYRSEINDRDRAARDQHHRDQQRWIEDSRYGSKRDGLWADVLRWARTGELLPDWRDLLPDYNRRIAAIFHEPYRDDVDGLVLHEFATLELQPWEPHCAEWRVALTAWYHDSLARHEREYRRRQENYSSRPRSSGSLNPDIDAQIACREADFEAIMAISHERRRDRIEAWYRAGLAAGGDPAHHHWVDWYRQRISGWDHRADTLYPNLRPLVATELASFDNPDRQSEMERLPDYWRLAS